MGNAHHVTVAQDTDPPLQVFISRLPRDVTEAQVRVFCEKAGEVHSLRVPRDPEGMNKG